MPLLNQVFLVDLDQFNNIVKVFNIVPYVLLEAISIPPYKVLNGKSPIFFDFMFIKKAINLEGFVFVNITFYKYGEGLF